MTTKLIIVPDGDFFFFFSCLMDISSKVNCIGLTHGRLILCPDGFYIQKSRGKNLGPI